jgi:hypothetical protein
VQDATTRQRIAFVEEDIERGNWNNAVKNAVSTYHRVASQIATTATNEREAAAMAAFEVGLPARWFHRFYEIEQRIRGDGAVTSEDAAFTLFFCCALAVGGDEKANSV